MLIAKESKLIDGTTLTASGILTILINVIVVFWLKERLKQSISHEYEKKIEAFKKEIQSELQHEQQVFNLGAMSHMAVTVFDRHVEFSELYIEKVMEAFHYLRRNRDSEKALDFAGDLTKLRFKFSAWLTNDIDEQLARFEKKLRTLGANSEYIKMPKGEGTDQAHRDQAARELLEILSAFTSWIEPSSSHPDVQLSYIHNLLRDVLGVNELVKIRELIVQNANSQLTRKGSQTR